MATTSVFNGTNLRLKIETVALGHTTSCSLTLSNDLPEATPVKFADLILEETEL